MKANKLQIGDYVNYRGQIIKVTSLYDKGGSNEVGWSEKESVWVNAINVEPIPLTSEILEKNGWHQTKSPEGFDMMVLSNDSQAVLWWFIKTFMLMLIGGSILKIKYVHELQHAMRLCGIEKEIEL